MKILIGIGHPKQVHIWKNIAKNLIKHGNEIKFLAADKDISRYLLDIYSLDYEIYKKNHYSLVKKALELFNGTSKALNIAKKFNPDILIAGTPYLAYISKILRKPHITISDTEHAFIDYWITYPFTDVICTPAYFMKKVNPRKHITFEGYFELSYLHPKYFTPDISVLDIPHLNKTDRFIVLRFVDWSASHDIGQSGINSSSRKKYISTLEKYGKVFISSESKLPSEFEKYSLKIAPEKFHSFLSYAQLYIGEGGSTATEAALLGTPSIHISTTAKFCGVFDDLSKYNLVYTFDDDSKALEKGIEILRDPKSKEKWIQRKDAVLKEKIDVTKFMVDLIEDFQESFTA